MPEFDSSGKEWRHSVMESFRRLEDKVEKFGDESRETKQAQAQTREALFYVGNELTKLNRAVYGEDAQGLVTKVEVLVQKMDSLHEAVTAAATANTADRSARVGFWGVVIAALIACIPSILIALL
jgi:hypothetical protein